MRGRIVFTGAGVARGVRLCLPLLIGTVPFGLVCGIAGQAHGLSFAETTLMSAVVYAGAAQLLALAAWTHPAPVFAATLAALVINLRYALMGPVLSPWLDRLRGWRLWGTLFVMVDQNWALSVKEMQEGGSDAGVLFGSGAIMWVVWVATTAIGYQAAQVVRPPPGHPLFFAAMAVFVALLVPMWRGRHDAMPWVVAAAVALLVSRVLPGTSWHIVAGALAGSTAGAVRDARRAR